MNVSKNLISFFNDHVPVFLSDDNCKLRVNGKVYDYADQSSVNKLLTPEMVLHYDLAEWYKLGPDDKSTYLKNFIEGTYRSELKEKAARKELIESKIKDSGMKLPDTDYILEQLQPCRIVGDARKEGGFVFLDRRTKEITEFDYHSVFFALARDIEEKTVRRFMHTIAHLQVEYNPHGDYVLKLVEDSNNLYAVNTYKAAPWCEIADDVEPTYDADIRKLIEHLFPVKEDQVFFFNWTYHSLCSRAGTYLYLNGGQGSGKNTLAKLLTKMHGENNSTNPKQESLKNRFNLYLKEKRFVFFDEFHCRSRQDKDILKSIINDRVQVEGKGQNQEDIEIHASYVIANNSLEAIGLEPIDRRFSVPDITHENIVDAHGRVWMQKLVKKLEDDKVIAGFAKWVLQEYKEPKYFSEEPYQGSRFEEIVLATARLGINETLNKVLKGLQPVYNYYDEKAEFARTHKSQRYPSIQDWQKFFKDVRQGGEPLGVIDGPRFTPIERYREEIDSEDLV